VSDAAGRKLFAQASHYSIASVFTLIAGVMTFPLLTRVFSVQEYGVMSLMGATLSLSVALGKTGLQHAVIRHFSEITAGKSRFSLPQLYSTTMIGMGATAALVMVGLAAGGRLVPSSWLADQSVRTLLAIVGVLAFVQVLDSGLTNLLRADQKTAALMKYQVAKKYLSLGCMFGGILLISRSLKMFYAATVVAEGTALLLLAHVVFRGQPALRPRAAGFSAPLYQELLAFGLPMTFGYELAGVILNVGDRYVIKAMIGETQLGLYAAAYNLCQYVQAVFITSVGQAITPIYMRMYDEQGPEKTSAFATRSMGNYMLFAAPVVAGVASVGPALLPSLASAKYAGAAFVLPWVISGMVVDGAATIAGAGLFIQRKTLLIMLSVAGSAAVNVAANVLLVPRLGIVGSAISTLIGYAVVYFTFALAGRRYLPVPLPWPTILRAVGAALVMYVALRFVVPGRGFLTVAVRGVLGLAIYGGVIATIDADGRALVLGGLRRLHSRLSGAS
jgi:O-antigen/teichoic acid export membrane protein